MIYRIRRAGPCDWTWEIVADNGWVVARAAKCFTTQEGAELSVRRVIESQGCTWWNIETPDASYLGASL